MSKSMVCEEGSANFNLLMQTDIYKLSFPVTYKTLSAQIIILDRFVFGGSPYLSDSQIFPVTVKPVLKVFHFCDY